MLRTLRCIALNRGTSAAAVEGKVVGLMWSCGANMLGVFGCIALGGAFREAADA